MAASHKATRVPLCNFGNDLEDFQLLSKAKKPRFDEPMSSAEMEALGKGPSVPNIEKTPPGLYTCLKNGESRVYCVED